MATKLKYDRWKTQDIKNWKFDIYSKTGEWLDHYNIPYKELSSLTSELVECVNLESNKLPSLRGVYNMSKPNEIALCFMIDTLNTIGFIPCLRGEITRDINGILEGESSLLKYEGLKDYKEREKKNLDKKVKKVLPEWQKQLDEYREAFKKLEGKPLYVKELSSYNNPLNLSMYEYARDLYIELPDVKWLFLRRFYTKSLQVLSDKYKDNKHRSMRILSEELTIPLCEELSKFELKGYEQDIKLWKNLIERYLKLRDKRKENGWEYWLE